MIHLGQPFGTDLEKPRVTHAHALHSEIENIPVIVDVRVRTNLDERRKRFWGVVEHYSVAVAGLILHQHLVALDSSASVIIAERALLCKQEHAEVVLIQHPFAVEAALHLGATCGRSHRRYQQK